MIDSLLSSPRLLQYLICVAVNLQYLSVDLFHLLGVIVLLVVYRGCSFLAAVVQGVEDLYVFVTLFRLLAFGGIVEADDD